MRAPSARAFATALAVALVLAAAPATAQEQAEAGTYRAANELNVRAAPSPDAAIVGVIPPAGRVAVSGCDAFGWCRVRFESLDGYAARQFLVRTGDLPADAFTLRFATPAVDAAAPADGVRAFTGRVTPGMPCAILEADDGREYPVVGNVPFDAAAPLRILAEEVATDLCGTGVALAILHVRLGR
ncbi:MAG: SH3 domain-containing protein [Bauldia sp.]